MGKLLSDLARRSPAVSSPQIPSPPQTIPQGCRHSTELLICSCLSWCSCPIVPNWEQLPFFSYWDPPQARPLQGGR